MHKKWLGFFLAPVIICLTGIFLMPQFQLSQIKDMPIDEALNAVLQFQACPPKSNNPNCPPPSPTNPPPPPPTDPPPPTPTDPPPPTPTDLPPPTPVPPSNSGSSSGDTSSSDQSQAGGFNLHGSQTAQAKELFADVNTTPTFTLPPGVTQFETPTNTIFVEVVPSQAGQSELNDNSMNNIFIIVTIIILVVIFLAVIIASKK